ncbi:M48 family metallopeptidase [Luteimonas sp. SX5]|uniref:M48 family metallopeptidase n=1 Tax=Luteimonas galliterrae TaxID=2940486 RepID=A0ABT0MHJ0_9GAMM|nr:M48 family metallopeptidase [Luteimonas galliterrae]MCL1634340.1 M48 family metallopeptidase [Luteimonas galliterrae]
MNTKAIAAALLLCLTACASQAPLRDNKPGTTPAAGSDEAELWYAMERAETELQRSPLRVRDPALNQYVRKVACEVAGEYCKDLRVYVMDVPQFNASMAPNGVMLVWTGALLRARDEAEIAFVLGHEAGHFRAQHSLRQWRRIKDTSAALGVFQVLAYGAGAPTTAMLGSLAGYATLFKFTRDQEREADRLGFQAIVAYGYDPRAGVDLWARMKREEDTRRYGKPSAIFSTHPATAERLADITAAAAAVPDPPRERHRNEYRAATRPYLEHWLDAEVARREYAASLLVIGELLKDSPSEDRGVLTFYLGEAHRRRNADGDRAAAGKLYAQAVNMPGAPPAAWREHGFALRDAGSAAAARAAFQNYLTAMPQADDRAFVQREMDKLGGKP